MIASLLFSLGFWLFFASVSPVGNHTSMGLSLAAMLACTVLVVVEGSAA
jgi:hypothetical protein